MKKNKLKKLILKEFKKLLQEQQNPFTYDWWDPNGPGFNYGVWEDSGIEITGVAGDFGFIDNFLNYCPEIYYAGINTVGSQIDWAFSDLFLENISSLPPDAPLKCVYFLMPECQVCGNDTDAYNAVEVVASGICEEPQISLFGCFWRWGGTLANTDSTVGEFIEFNTNYDGLYPEYSSARNAAWMDLTGGGFNSLNQITTHLTVNIYDDDVSCTRFEQTIETDGDLSDAGIFDTVDFCKACLEGTVPVLEEFCECCDRDPINPIRERGYNCRGNLGGDPTAQKCIPCGPTGDCEFETEEECIDSGCEYGCDDLSPAENAWLCTSCNQGSAPENLQHLCGCGCDDEYGNVTWSVGRKGEPKDKDIKTLQKRAGIKEQAEWIHCNPDTGEPCNQNQTCSYQGSAAQYICVDNEALSIDGTFGQGKPKPKKPRRR